mgnify:CR=1 FL=1
MPKAVEIIKDENNVFPNGTKEKSVISTGRWKGAGQVPERGKNLHCGNYTVCEEL